MLVTDSIPNPARRGASGRKAVGVLIGIVFIVRSEAIVEVCIIGALGAERLERAVRTVAVAFTLIVVLITAQVPHARGRFAGFYVCVILTRKQRRAAAGVNRVPGSTVGVEISSLYEVGFAGVEVVTEEQTFVVTPAIASPGFAPLRTSSLATWTVVIHLMVIGFALFARLAIPAPTGNADVT